MLCQYAPKLGKVEVGKQSVYLMDATRGRAVLKRLTMIKNPVAAWFAVLWYLPPTYWKSQEG